MMMAVAVDGNRLVALISSNIQKLSQHVQQMEMLVAKLGPRADEQIRAEIQKLAQTAGALSRETNGLMKELVTLSNEQRQLKVQRERLMGELMSVLNRLQTVQRRAEGQEKESMRRVEAETGHILDTDRMAQVQAQSEQVSLSELRQRQEAINQLEQEIGDVNQIFKDLSRLVHEQGEMVDSIEANVEHTSIFVQQGAANVQQAVHYNAKARQKKFFLCIFLLLLALIICLVLYFYFKK